MKLVCTSTSEAEFVALYHMIKEALYVGYLVQEVFEQEVWPINVYCDNKAVTDIAHQAGASDLTKFMVTKYFKIQEWVEGGYIQVLRVESKMNVADGFTKVGKDFNNFKRLLQARGSVPTKQDNHDVCEDVMSLSVLEGEEKQEDMPDTAKGDK